MLLSCEWFLSWSDWSHSPNVKIIPKFWSQQLKLIIVNLRHQLENIILNSKFISPELTHPPRTRALARVLWLCVNSREVNFDEGFYPTDDVVYFISPKTVLKQHGELWYLILFTFLFMKIWLINWFSKRGRSTGFQSREIK